MINEVVNGVAGLENRPRWPLFRPVPMTMRVPEIPMGDPVAAAHYRKESNHSNGYWSCLWQ